MFGALVDGNFGPGCADQPGYSHLPSIHSLLYVGNEISAANAHNSGVAFDVVISTVIPRSLHGTRARHLSTHEVLFEDGQGSESADGAAVARECILRGVELVEEAIREGKCTLVHCAWGQNRSCAICCAYAVMHCGMDAEAAIQYVQERNLADRRYYGQKPPGGAMHNDVFCQIVKSLEQLKRPA